MLTEQAKGLLKATIFNVQLDPLLLITQINLQNPD
jgi:hypothetical protein